jgi:group I intron endonuclease
MKYTINDKKIFPKTIGIYKISFINNTGKVYIGSTSNKMGFQKRWYRHISSLSKNKSNLPALQNAANKYGINNIQFEILEECKKDDCVDREQYYIDKYNSYKCGYNSRPIARTNLSLIWTQNSRNNVAKTYRLKRDKYFNDIYQLYVKNDLSIKKISLKLNICCGTITKILNENNITIEKNKRPKIKIYQYDIFGTFIKKFNSIRECSRIMNITTNSISDVLKCRCRHANFYYYSTKYLEKTEVINNINILNLNQGAYINIKQMDLNGNIIKIWKNIKEIKEYNNISIQNLRKALRNNSKYKGYYWEI